MGKIIQETYDIGRIMVDAAMHATWQIISDFEEKYPNEIFDPETLLCLLDETDDELIEFFHKVALKYKREKHIAVTRSITGKSLSTIERRVN